MKIFYSLYDRLLDRRALAKAFEKVRRASGAPGADGQTISDFQSCLFEELNRLVNELRTKTYQPQPVLRVTIPKPGGGERHLGIPAVRDRVIQQALLDILQPIFDPDFHPSSYGYRPGRSCQMAVAKATMFILCASRSGAEHAFQVATEILEGRLKLTVNREKTHLVQASQGVKFLGVQIYLSRTSIQDKKIDAFKEKVKALTRRNSPVNLEQVINDLNPVLRGFANYFRMANCKKRFRDLSLWIRRRLRQKQLSDWKNPSRLHRRLRKLGYQGTFPKIRMRSWRSARSPQANYAMPNAWLDELGLYDIASVETGVLPKIT